MRSLHEAGPNPIFEGLPAAEFIAQLVTCEGNPSALLATCPELAATGFTGNFRDMHRAIKSTTLLVKKPYIPQPDTAAVQVQGSFYIAETADGYSLGLESTDGLGNVIYLFGAVDEAAANAFASFAPTMVRASLKTDYTDRDNCISARHPSTGLVIHAVQRLSNTKAEILTEYNAALVEGVVVSYDKADHPMMTLGAQALEPLTVSTEAASRKPARVTVELTSGEQIVIERACDIPYIGYLGAPFPEIPQPGDTVRALICGTREDPNCLQPLAVRLLSASDARSTET